MAEIISEIGTGGQYATIDAWLTASGTGGNSLDTTGGSVTVDYTGTNVYVGKVLNNLSIAKKASSAAIDITGAPTTSTSYRILRGTVGTRPLLTGTGWSHDSDAGSRFIQIAEQYSRVEDIEATLGSVGGSGTTPASIFRAEANDTVFLRCVARDTAGNNVGLRGFTLGAAGAVGTSFIRCAVVNLSITSASRNIRAFDCGLVSGGAVGKIINCVALNIDGAGGTATGFQTSAGSGCTLDLHNNIAANVTGTTANTDFIATGAGTINRSNNMSEDATGDSGFTGITPSAVFVDVTVGAEDFHLLGSGAAVNAGQDRSALFADAATDIDGATVSGTWDIGADEVSALSASLLTVTAVTAAQVFTVVGSGIQLALPVTSSVVSLPSLSLLRTIPLPTATVVPSAENLTLEGLVINLPVASVAIDAGGSLAISMIMAAVAAEAEALDLTPAQSGSTSVPVASAAATAQTLTPITERIAVVPIASATPSAQAFTPQISGLAAFLPVVTVVVNDAGGNGVQSPSRGSLMRRRGRGNFNRW